MLLISRSIKVSRDLCTLISNVIVVSISRITSCMDFNVVNNFGRY